MVKKSGQKPTFKNKSGHKKQRKIKGLRHLWSNGQIFLLFNVKKKTLNIYKYRKKSGYLTKGGFLWQTL